MNDLETVLSSDALVDLLNQERAQSRLDTLSTVMDMTNYGFIETKNGTVLTSAAAEAAAESKA